MQTKIPGGKMKLIKTKKVPEEIEVTLPYYYKQCIFLDSSESMIYGRVSSKESVVITITDRYLSNEKEYSLEITKEHPQNSSCYFEHKYESNIDEFLKAKAKFMNALISV